MYFRPKGHVLYPDMLEEVHDFLAGDHPAELLERELELEQTHTLGELGLDDGAPGWRRYELELVEAAEAKVYAATKTAELIHNSWLRAHFGPWLERMRRFDRRRARRLYDAERYRAAQRCRREVTA